MTRRGPVVGAAAAAVWNAYEPLLKRAFRTPYADSEVLGPFLTQGRLEWLANLLTHAGGGATFGYLFERLGGRGVKNGVTAAVVENTLLWPAVAVIERVHPKRRSGEWPPLLFNARAFAAATVGHAIFGILLGAGVSDDGREATGSLWTKIGQLRSPARRATSAAGSPPSSPGAAGSSGR
jgi:hypothetical protein